MWSGSEGYVVRDKQGQNVIESGETPIPTALENGPRKNRCKQSKIRVNETSCRGQYGGRGPPWACPLPLDPPPVSPPGLTVSCDSALVIQPRTVLEHLKNDKADYSLENENKINFGGETFHKCLSESDNVTGTAKRTPHLSERFSVVCVHRFGHRFVQILESDTPIDAKQTDGSFFNQAEPAPKI